MSQSDGRLCSLLFNTCIYVLGEFGEQLEPQVCWIQV
jgi:hypothetical protein